MKYTLTLLLIIFSLTATYSQNVGIGTTSPGAKLEVVGQVKITGGSPGFGKSLISDSNGLATWQAGPISKFAMFYGLTSGTGNGGPSDYFATIPTKTAAGTGRVPFPRNGPAAGIVRNDVSSFILPSIGTYEITFRMQTTEPSQIELEINGLELPETLAANMSPSFGGHPIIGNFLITTTSVNSILAVINPGGNAISFTITPADGSNTHAKRGNSNTVD